MALNNRSKLLQIVYLMLVLLIMLAVVHYIAR